MTDDLVHHFCCDPDRALCGEDLSEGEECPLDAGQPCVVCADLALLDDCSVTCPLVVFS